MNKYPPKCNVTDLNKIQNLLTSIRSSRSNKISKGGTDSVKKPSAYRHEPIGYKSTLEPKTHKYRDYSTNINTINHRDLYENVSLSTSNYKKNKALKYFNGGGRKVFQQLCNKLRKYENLKSLYASNETIKSSLNTSSISCKYPVKQKIETKSKTSLNHDRIMKKHQKEITMIAKKKRDYMLAQAKSHQPNNQTNNGNTTASTIMMSLANANNLSITEYPGLNESLMSLNPDFGKMRIGDYVPPTISHPNVKKVNGGRNSTKKFLHNAHTEIRKKNSGSVDKRKYDQKRNTGSRKRSEEGPKSKSKKKNAHVDSGLIRSSCSNSNFPNIDPAVFISNHKASKKTLKVKPKKEKSVKRNLIGQARLGRRKIEAS